LPQEFSVLIENHGEEGYQVQEVPQLPRPITGNTIRLHEEMRENFNKLNAEIERILKQLEEIKEKQMSSCSGAEDQVKKQRRDNNQTLGDDLQELWKILPIERVTEWTKRKLDFDLNAKELLKYLKSDHFKAINEHLWKSPDMVDFVQFLEDNGVRAREGFLQFYRKFDLFYTIPGEVPNIQPMTPKWISKPLILWDLKVLDEELEALVTTETRRQVMLWAVAKSRSENIRRLRESLRSEKFENIFIHLNESKQFQEFVELLKKGNLDIESFKMESCKLLEWSRLC